MIGFRRVECDDFALLRHWLAQPHVHRWWHHESTPEAIERDFGPTLRGEEPAEDLLAFEYDVPFALVQRSRWIDYPGERAELAPFVEVPEDAMTIDYLIGEPGEVGRGRGTSLVIELVRHTWAAHPTCHSLVVPVAVGNRRSWRVLEKAGFTRVADAELEPDNPADPPQHHVYRLDRPR